MSHSDATLLLCVKLSLELLCGHGGISRNTMVLSWILDVLLNINLLVRD